VILLAAVLALPLGLLLRARSAAYLAYLAVFAYCFTFQSTYLTTAWVRGNPDAGFPADGAPSLSYLAVTLTIYLTGFGLVTLGHAVRQRRSAGGRAQRTSP
jgi:hypothetical protein